MKHFSPSLFVVTGRKLLLHKTWLPPVKNKLGLADKISVVISIDAYLTEVVAILPLFLSKWSHDLVQVFPLSMLPIVRRGSRTYSQRVSPGSQLYRDHLIGHGVNDSGVSM